MEAELTSVKPTTSGSWEKTYFMSFSMALSGSVNWREHCITCRVLTTILVWPLILGRATLLVSIATGHLGSSLQGFDVAILLATDHQDGAALRLGVRTVEVIGLHLPVMDVE